MVRPDESSPHFQLLQKENDLQYYAQLKEWKSKEKKAVTIAMMTSWSNASFIYTPYLFRNADKPRYALAMGAMGVFSLLCAATAF